MLAMQGPHQVAQKSSRTTLPLSDARVIGSAFFQVSTLSAGGAPPVFRDSNRPAREASVPSSHSAGTLASPTFTAGPDRSRSGSPAPAAASAATSPNTPILRAPAKPRDDRDIAPPGKRSIRA